MRERFDKAHNRYDSADTLGRLQEALAALERRVEGTVRQPGQDVRESRGDVATIRARQERIERERRARLGPDDRKARPDGLRREIGRLREDVDREMKASAGGFDALRDEIRAMRASAGSVDALRQEVRAMRDGPQEIASLRQDIEHLKSTVTALAREDSVRDLSERWSMIEREIANLPQTLASREELGQLANRFDDMRRVIDALPQSAQLDKLDADLHTLAGAVEQVARQSAQVHPSDLADIDARLDEISRAIAAIPTSRPETVDKNLLERMEARITALANQVDAYAQAVPTHDYEAQFSELADRIDGLRLGAAPGTVPGEAMDALNARIDEIAAALDALTREEALSGEQVHLATAELEQRLAAIDEQLRQASASSERSVEQVVRSVDDRMAEIARRIDQNEQSQALVPSIAQLEHRLDDITAMLTSGRNAQQPPVDLSSLEAQIADLSASLSTEQPTPFDEETIWTAARAAAEEVAARVSLAGEQAMPETLGRLTDDLRALETLARDTDSRNAKTFEAIHDTLLQVVDHLASLEDKVRQAPVSASEGLRDQTPGPDASRAAASAQAPLRIDDAPPLAAELDEPTGASQTPRAALSPAEAAAEAALFALGENQDLSSRSPDKEAEPRGFFKSVTDRLPLGRGRGETEPGEADRVDADADTPAPPVVEDQPIEPVGDRLALADIMARVRSERAPAAAAQGAPEQAEPSTDAGKADFIAAARRAAQAAAADANIASSGRQGGNTGAAGSIGSFISRRRKPIVIAAGAILLAILAIPLVRGILTPETTSLAVDATPPAAVATPAVDGGGAEPATSGEASVRDVTAQQETAEPAAAPAPSPVTTDDAEPAVADTPAPADPVRAPEPAAETADVETISVDDIPDRIGPIALREAATGGDPKALHVIGDRIAMEAEGDPAALSEAFTWYERSAELGFAPAQYRLGNFYEKGIGTERDLAAAKTWYQLAAEQGNASAMHNLAVLFASGAAGTADFDSAARWFLRAAELGVRDSQFNLGILSAKGQGMPQDLGESYKWFALAAQSGDDDAAAKRDDIANVLRPDQLEQARGATALWKPKPVDQDVNVVSVPEAWQTDGQRTAAAAPLSGDDMKRAIANIQAILNDQGYDAGPVDGIMGDKTRQAIMDFQRDSGLAATGDVDQALVESLLAIASGEG